MNHTIPLIVRAENRVWIPESKVPDWFSTRDVYMYPLGWDQDLRLPRRRFFHAWRIVPTIDDHVVEIEKVRDSEAAYLAGFIFAWKIGSKASSSWCFQIPTVFRERGWLPEQGSGVVVVVDQEKVSLWNAAAHEHRAITLSKLWANRLRGE